MRFLFLSCFIFVFLPFGLKGQTFAQTIGQAGLNEGGQTIIQSSDGNLFLGGYKSDSALIIKIDPQGNILWSRTFLPVAISGYINNIYHLVITPDGFLIGAGTAIRASPYDMKGFYFKFDLNGNMQWCQRIVDPRIVYCQRIMPVSSTQYILFEDIYDMSSATGPDVLTARIDATNGNVTWLSSRNNYMNVNAYIDDVGSATFGRNNAMYTTGRIYVNGSPATGMRPYISKFDNMGNMLWSNYLVFTAAQSARIYGMDLIYDNDSLVYSYSGDKFGASNNFTPGLIKTDTLGNVAWSKDYDIGISASEISNAVVRLPNGYALIGYTGVYSAATSRDLFVIMTDLNGNMLWAKTYGTATMGEYQRTSYTHIGVVAGNTLYFTGQQDNGVQTDVVIYATDFNGNIVCQPPTPIVPNVTNNPTNTTVCNMTYPTATLAISSITQTASPIFPNQCNYSLNLGNDTTVCNPLTLNATITGATSYLWQNGSTQATLTTTGPGIYWVDVSVNCCWITDTIQIFGGGGATAQFIPTVPPCGSGPVTFANSSTGTTNYYWDFGDSSNDTIANPSHIYTSSGTYTVTLIASGPCGIDTTVNVVTIDYSLTAFFNIGNVQGCGPLTINFQDSSSVTTGNITGWLWDFGDGNTSTQQNPQHTYTIPGTYNVILTVTSSAGCTVTYTGAGVVIVFPDPVANFSVQNSPVTLMDPTANFIDLSTGAVTWQWDFGDNTTSILQNPQHLYGGIGNYPITLVVTNSYGCTDTATLLLEILGEFTFYVPNCFTPNGNGNNESFTGMGQGIVEFHMMIFDRWGMLLYETYDINKPWDGTFKGNMVEEDVYVYKIDLKDIFFSGHNYTGHVSVVR